MSVIVQQRDVVMRPPDVQRIDVPNHPDEGRLRDVGHRHRDVERHNHHDRGIMDHKITRIINELCRIDVGETWI